MSGWKRAVETEPEMHDSEVVKNVVVIAIVFMIFVSVLSAMWANYSGILRYALIVFSVSTLLLIPAYFLFQNSAESVLKAREAHRYPLKGKSDELATLIRRAFSGYRASQALLEENLREIMIERISVRRGMSVEEVKKRVSGFHGAMEIVKDEEIAWLLSKKRRLGGKKRLIIRPSKKYRERIERIIKKMEEWN